MYRRNRKLNLSFSKCGIKQRIRKWICRFMHLTEHTDEIKRKQPNRMRGSNHIVCDQLVVYSYMWYWIVLEAYGCFHALYSVVFACFRSRIGEIASNGNCCLGKYDSTSWCLSSNSQKIHFGITFELWELLKFGITVGLKSLPYLNTK